MQKKLLKIIEISITLIFIITICTSTYAATMDPESIVSNPTHTGVSSLYELGNTILGIIQYIGGGVAVIATFVLAIRYLYSTPDDKAEIKKKLIPYIMGGVMVFGAVLLVRIVETFVKDIT